MWASLLGNLKEERCEPGTTHSCTQQPPPTMRPQTSAFVPAWSELHLRKSLGWHGGKGGKWRSGAVTYAAVALLNVREVDEEGDVIHVDTAVDRIGEETRGILAP